MSDKPISDVRARMIADMTIRTFSEETQRDYIRNVEAFARLLGRTRAKPANCSVHVKPSCST